MLRTGCGSPIGRQGACSRLLRGVPAGARGAEPDEAEAEAELDGQDPSWPKAALRALRAAVAQPRSAAPNSRPRARSSCRSSPTACSGSSRSPSRWIEGTLEWRQRARPPARPARQQHRRRHRRRARAAALGSAEVREEVLAAERATTLLAADYFLSRFYDDVLSILEGLLQGNQQVRRDRARAARPADRLVELAGREAQAAHPRAGRPPARRSGRSTRRRSTRSPPAATSTRPSLQRLLAKRQKSAAAGAREASLTGALGPLSPATCDPSRACPGRSTRAAAP